MKNVKVTYEIIRPDVYPPIYKRYGDAGFDLRCGKHFYLKPGGNLVPSGTKFCIPYGCEGQVRPRSGCSMKGIPAVTVEYFFKKCGVNFVKWAAKPDRCEKGSIYDAIEKFIDAHDEVNFYEDELIAINTNNASVRVGTVDAGYRNEVKTIVTYSGTELYVIPRNARISQMVINELPSVELVNGTVTEDSERGLNGIGSTGSM